ncbi:MAG: four helix bundle protein [Verrucomicrobia bacterium]|nr:four helix bundle protein [Verrucomicrobiota bacterium]
MFSHTRLKVYHKALASVAHLAQRSASWDRRHSVVDHLLRASESIVLNLAEGARRWSAGHKQHSLDYATGSALECAACLDIAVLKQFLPPDAAHREKSLLCEIVKMLVGLRKSWGEAGFHEDSPAYDAEAVALFPHERLHVYQVGLEFIRWSQKSGNMESNCWGASP